MFTTIGLVAVYLAIFVPTFLAFLLGLGSVLRDARSQAAPHELVRVPRTAPARRRQLPPLR